MKPTNSKYSLRDFYTEEGKSLRMDYKKYWNGCCRYREKKIVSTAIWKLFKKMHRINCWHKMDVFHRNIGKGYTCSTIWAAQIRK